MKKRCVGLTLPDNVNSYIIETAQKDHRSLSNFVSLIVIDYYTRNCKSAITMKEENIK